MSEQRPFYQVFVDYDSRYEPHIWRRLLIPSGITFHKFHKIIQAAFDWQDYHLYLFDFNDFLVVNSDPDTPFHDIEKNPKKVKIDPVFKEYKQFYMSMILEIHGCMKLLLRKLEFLMKNGNIQYVSVVNVIVPLKMLAVLVAMKNF